VAPFDPSPSGKEKLEVVSIIEDATQSATVERGVARA
jgi:hypothetical protein